MIFSKKRRPRRGRHQPAKHWSRQQRERWFHPDIESEEVNELVFSAITLKAGRSQENILIDSRELPADMLAEIAKLHGVLRAGGIGYRVPLILDHHNLQFVVERGLPPHLVAHSREFAGEGDRAPNQYDWQEGFIGIYLKTEDPGPFVYGLTLPRRRYEPRQFTGWDEMPEEEFTDYCRISTIYSASNVQGKYKDEDVWRLASILNRERPCLIKSWLPGAQVDFGVDGLPQTTLNCAEGILTCLAALQLKEA